jgi:hypothetical protein
LIHHPGASRHPKFLYGCARGLARAAARVQKGRSDDELFLAGSMNSIPAARFRFSDCANFLFYIRNVFFGFCFSISPVATSISGCEITFRKSEIIFPHAK